MKRPEQSLHLTIARYLDLALPDRALWWTSHQNPKSARDGGRLKAMGLRAGIPDILVLFDGMLIGLELKAPKGRISPAQSEIADKFAANDAAWHLCRSVEDVEAALRQYAIPLKARAA